MKIFGSCRLWLTIILHNTLDIIYAEVNKRNFFSYGNILVKQVHILLKKIQLLLYIFLAVQCNIYYLYSEWVNLFNEWVIYLVNGLI